MQLLPTIWLHCGDYWVSFCIIDEVADLKGKLHSFLRWASGKGGFFVVLRKKGKLTDKRTGCSNVSSSFEATVSYGSRQMAHSLFAGSSLRGTFGDCFRKSAMLMLIHVFKGTLVRKRWRMKEGGAKGNKAKRRFHPRTHAKGSVSKRTRSTPTQITKAIIYRIV